MLLFNIFLTYKNPVILIPPFFGSNLWVTYNNSNLPWYCPKSENNKLLWLGASYLIPHKINCMLKLMTTFTDKNGNLTNWPNSSVFIHDFGGDESARYVIHKKYISTFSHIIDHFKKLGWEMKKDLFVAPFDWRIAPTFSDSFWPDFKKLIEQAYSTTETQVTLIGFSQGGQMVHQFLTKHCISEWKEKFISQVIFISPAFTGFVQDLYNLWTRFNPFAPFISLGQGSVCFENMPGIYGILPNEVVYKEAVIAIGPDGEEFRGKDLHELLMNHRLTNPNMRKLFQKTEDEIIGVAPSDIGVKTTLLMNSGLKTTVALNFSNGFEKRPVKIFGGGDGTLAEYGYRWVCNNWKNISCVDFNNSANDYRHYPLISNIHVLNFVSNITYYGKIPEFKHNEKYFNNKDEL